MLNTASALRDRHWKLQQAAGLDFIPSNDFPLYDHVLDALVLIGATPERFGDAITLERYFAMARNSREQTAMEMVRHELPLSCPGMDQGPGVPIQPSCSVNCARLALWALQPDPCSSDRSHCS